MGPRERQRVLLSKSFKYMIYSDFLKVEIPQLKRALARSLHSNNGYS